MSRLAALNPAVHEESPNVLDAKFWEMALSSQPQGEEHEKALAELLAELACSSNSAPFVARGLIRNDRLKAAGAQFANVADQLRKGRSDPAACPGVKGFTDKDWDRLSELSPNR